MSVLARTAAAPAAVTFFGLALVLGACRGDPTTARGQVPVPTVRLMSGAASETLRRTYQNAAHLPFSGEELGRESAWIDSAATPLRAFWDAHGERVLADVSEFAGVGWVEEDVNVYFVRQDIGPVAFSLPLVMDLSVLEQVAGLPPPEAAFHQRLLAWALVHELVHRVYDQASIARGTVGSEAELPEIIALAGSRHDWDDVVVAFVMRDVLGPELTRPLLYNRGLQRTIGIYRLDRIAPLLARWPPARGRSLQARAREDHALETGLRHPAARRRVGELLADHGAVRGQVEPADVRAAADSIRTEFALGMDAIAQLLSDWEGQHGEGRLGVFPYRDDGGAWTWR
ncbi:MAG: hypothetical protein H0V09_06660 [Gemmatimonadetes bacterium]|nr:hypothetical protein [Gemmatimonadota bacterium]